MNIFKYIRHCYIAYAAMPNAINLIIQTSDAENNHKLTGSVEDISSQMVMHAVGIAEIKSRLPQPCTNEKYLNTLTSVFSSILKNKYQEDEPQ